MTKLNYNKSDSFRVFNIDYFRIELTENLDIQLSLCSDRPPEESVNGGETIREVEIDAIMNLSTAKSLFGNGELGMERRFRRLFAGNK
ncbi:MAG: hypothetical protein F6K35_31780 [Okeania sp. SIO2H7]|nr:hypothetical protein [Okeania sp. SIO2H7]